MADMQRAGGIGADELHLHRLPGAGSAAAVGRSLPRDLVEHLVPAAGGEKEIDEAGAGDLHLLPQAVAGTEGRDQGLGHLARRLFFLAGEQHGDIAGEIAVAGLAGNFDDKGRNAAGLEGPGSVTGLERGEDSLAQTFFHGVSLSRNGVAPPPVAR